MVRERFLMLSPPRLAVLVMLAVSGCAAPTWPAPEVSAARAAGLDGSIRIHHDAMPLDVADVPEVYLSLPDAVALAVNHDPRLQAALWRVRQAHAQAKQARLLPNPVLDIALRFPAGGGSPAIEAGLTAEFLALLRKPGAVRTADHRLRAAGAEALTVALDVVAEVRTHYRQVQAMERLAELLIERQTTLEAMLGVAEARLRHGEGTRLNVTTFHAQRMELALERGERLSAARAARLALARAIGTPSAPAAWALDAATPGEEPGAPESAWIAHALMHRPEIQARTWELAALGVEVRLTGWFSLEGDAGAAAEREDGSWSAGPALVTALPVFDWGQARRAEMEARRAEAIHLLTALQRQAVEEVRRAHSEYEALRAAWATVRDELLPLAQRRRDENETAFRAGEAAVVAVLLAEQDLLAAHVRAVALQHRMSEALIRLQRAAGGAAPQVLTGKETS